MNMNFLLYKLNNTDDDIVSVCPGSSSYLVSYFAIVTQCDLSIICKENLYFSMLVFLTNILILTHTN